MKIFRLSEIIASGMPLLDINRCKYLIIIVDARSGTTTLTGGVTAHVNILMYFFSIPYSDLIDAGPQNLFRYTSRLFFYLPKRCESCQS